MPYSTVSYTAGAAQTDFEVTFPYLLQSHVAVTVNSVSQTSGVDYNWLDSDTIRFVTPLVGGETVSIVRNTPIDAKFVDFDASSYLTEASLDSAFNQFLYNNQEEADAGNSAAASAAAALVSEINAAASETNAATSESDCNKLTQTAFNTTIVGGTYDGLYSALHYEEAAQQFAIQPEDSFLTVTGHTSDYSALHHAAKASTSETNAATSESDCNKLTQTAFNTTIVGGTYDGLYSALHYEEACQQFAIQPEDSFLTITGHTSDYSALHHASKASTSATNASNSESDTNKLTQTAEDVPISGSTGGTYDGLYSALHHQTKATAAAATAVGAAANVTNTGLPLYRNLRVTRPTTTTVKVNADYVILRDEDNELSYKADNVEVTLDITTTGVNGLDQGSATSGYWYYIYLIYNNSTVAGLFVGELKGTNASVTTNKLVITGGSFLTNGTSVGDIVYNNTDNTEAVITTIDDNNTLTLSSDIFTGTGKSYTVIKSPIMPSGYTYKKLVSACFYIDGTSFIKTFQQFNEVVVNNGNIVLDATSSHKLYLVDWGYTPQKFFVDYVQINITVSAEASSNLAININNNANTVALAIASLVAPDAHAHTFGPLQVQYQDTIWSYTMNGSTFSVSNNHVFAYGHTLRI